MYRYVTCAHDHTVRLWDLDGRRMIKSANTGALPRCLAYSPDGLCVAVGLESGELSILGSDTLSESVGKSVARDAITDIKYSPDGEILAVASRDSRIYLFDVSSKYRRYAICKVC